MTKLYVQEFVGLAETPYDDVLASPAEPPIASYVVDYTTGVTSGPVYQPTTRWLLVASDSTCSVRFDGTAATTTDRRMYGNLAPVLIGIGSVPNGRASAITNA